MRRFNITVNGKTYLVEAEEIGGVAAPAAQAPVMPSAPPPPAPAPAPAAAGGNTVVSPMPGKVLDIKVKEGDPVESGQVLLILEAMKMENEIMADRSGTVDKIIAAVGAAVNSGDALITLR